MMKRLWIGAIALMLGLFLFGAALAQDLHGTVTQGANLRAGPGTTYALVGKAQAGAAVTITAKNEAGDCYQLKGGGWIAAFLVKVDGASPTAATQAATPGALATGIDIRNDPVFLAYSDGLKDVLDHFTAGSDILGQRFTEAGDNTSVMFTSEWRVNTGVGLFDLSLAAEGIRKLTPPAYLSDAHGDLLEMAAHLDKAVDLLTKGIDTFDADKMKTGSAEFNAAIASMNSSKAKMEAFVATFVTPTPATATVKPTVKAAVTPTATRTITSTRRMTSTVTPTPVKTKAPAKPTILAPTSTPLPTVASIPSSNSRCLDVPQSIIAALTDGLTVSGGGTLDHAKAVKSKDFDKVFFVAAVIHGKGMGVGQIGVWATNRIEAADGLLFSVNAMANEFSDWGDGSTTQAQLSMSNDGAAEAEACAKASLDEPTTTPISDGTNAGDWEKANLEQRTAIVHYFYEFWKKNENGNIGISEQEMMVCIIDQVALPYTQQHPTMLIMSLASRCIKQ